MCNAEKTQQGNSSEQGERKNHRFFSTDKVSRFHQHR